MCLGVPTKVIKIDEEWAWVEVNRVQLKINASLVEEVRPGDYVIVHAGFAIQKLSPKEGASTLELFKQIMESEPR